MTDDESYNVSYAIKSCFFFCGVFTIRCKRGYLYFFYQLVSTCGYRPSSTAFLFSLVNKPGVAPVTFRPPGASYSYQHATFSCSSYGPTFGGPGSGHDIYISSEASSNKNSHSNLGNTYEPPSGYSYGSEFAQSFLAGSYNFQPDEVEVFYETGYK